MNIKTSLLTLRVSIIYSFMSVNLSLSSREVWFLVAKLLYKYLCPTVRLSVRQVFGETWFSRSLIKIEVWFVRASLLMDVGILVVFFKKRTIIWSSLHYDICLTCAGTRICGITGGNGFNSRSKLRHSWRR